MSRPWTLTQFLNHLTVESTGYHTRLPFLDCDRWWRPFPDSWWTSPPYQRRLCSSGQRRILKSDVCTSGSNTATRQELLGWTLNVLSFAAFALLSFVGAFHFNPRGFSSRQLALRMYNLISRSHLLSSLLAVARILFCSYVMFLRWNLSRGQSGWGSFHVLFRLGPLGIDKRIQCWRCQNLHAVKLNWMKSKIGHHRHLRLATKKVKVQSVFFWVSTYLKRMGLFWSKLLTFW